MLRGTTILNYRRQGAVKPLEKSQRYESIKIDTVFTYDLRRAYETAQIMFERKNVPIIQDARLRSWDYGNLTQRSRAEVTVV